MFGKWNGIFVIVLVAQACVNFRTLSPEERQVRLERGEILNYLKPIPNTRLTIGEAQAIIAASPQRLWNAITDYNRQSEIAPRTRSVKITKIENNTTWVDLVLNAPWPLHDAAFTLKVEHDKKELKTHWNLVEGNIKESYGSWDIDPVPENPNVSLVTYTLLYDDGRALPRWIVGSFTKKAVKEYIEVMRQHVNDAVYDRPIYAISVLDARPAGPKIEPTHGNTDFDEETKNILR